MRRLALLLSFLLIFSVVGCQKQPTMEESLGTAFELAQKGADQVEAEMKRSEEERKAEFQANQVPVSDAEISDPKEASVRIKSYGIYEDNGDQLITFTADFTNLCDGYEVSLEGIFPDAYQNGVRLGRAYEGFNKDVNTSVKTGTTLEVSFSYILRDTTTAVELEYSAFELLADGTDVGSVCTISLQS